MEKNKTVEPPRLVAVCVYISFSVMYVFGFLRSCLKSMGILKVSNRQKDPEDGFVSLYGKMEKFYTSYCFGRCRECWNRTVVGCAGTKIKVQESINDFENSELKEGKLYETINTGSYNYLGFGEVDEPNYDYLKNIVKKYGHSHKSLEGNMKKLIRELEVIVANHLGVEDSICFGMGFATNSYNISCLVDDQCCVISDEMNHASIIVGVRHSSAKVRVFKHNDMEDLENILIEVTRSRCRWKKILIVVEGLYSMEGTLVDLPRIIHLKKKYKAYLYLDEAHSIGAIGKHGKGVVEHFNLNPKDVDILMGTFTKSFGAAGGYIASNKKVINYLRNHSECFLNAQPMSPVVIGQIIYSFKTIKREITENMETSRINKLKQNTRYFRKRLSELGFIIQGDEDSPVVPMMIYLPCKMAQFCKLTLRKGVATVVVCFPATSITTARCRFCISASHTKEMLDEVLSVVSEVGDELRLKYGKVDTFF